MPAKLIVFMPRPAPRGYFDHDTCTGGRIVIGFTLAFWTFVLAGLTRLVG
jgi:hypothetical protein